MTAIGLFLFIFGALLVRGWGSPYYSWSMSNWADKFGIPAAVIGFILVNIGVFMKLWEVMP
jgi:hypothetical protein